MEHLKNELLSWQILWDEWAESVEICQYFSETGISLNWKAFISMSNDWTLMILALGSLRLNTVSLCSFFFREVSDFYIDICSELDVLSEGKKWATKKFKAVCELKWGSSWHK